MRALCLSTLSLCLACGGPLGQAQSRFEDGHYAAARQVLISMGVPTDLHERARYALYRGLTHGALGDVPRAAVWLREAKNLEDAWPDALSEQDALRLKAGLDTYQVP